MWRRNDRINERDVPESQHTIFMRGFPGEMGTDQIRDFLEKEDFGTCSFDFVKVNPDRTKLYVAVRFESKSCAREAMERFGPEGEMLGYKVELSWFRDIRRYLAHCAKQGVRPSRFRGGGGGGCGGGGGMGQHRQVYHNQRGGGFIGRGAQHRGKRHTGGEVHEGQRSRSASRSRSADTNSRTGSPASPRRARSGSANSRRSSSAGRSRSAGSRRRSRSSSSQSVATNSSLGGGAGAGDDRSSLEREKSLDYSDIVTTRKEQKQRELSHSPTPPPLKKSKKAVLKRLKKGKKDKDRHRDHQQHRCSSKKKVKQYGKQQQQLKQHQPQQQNMTSPHSSSGSSPEARHRHRTEESDVEMASDEEEQQQQTEHEQQQEMNTKSSSKTKQKHQQIAVGGKKSSFVNRFLPAGAGAGTVTGGTPSIDGSSVKTTVTSAELRSHTIVLDLSDPKTNAMPLNFKPFDDASSVDCMLNDSLNASSNNNNGGTTTTPVAVASAISPILPQIRNGPTENNAVGKMPQQNGAGGGGGAGLALSSFKDIQRAVLTDIHYKVPHETGGTAGGTSDEDAAPMGQLRLSALSRKGTAEEKREEKVAKLSPELRERVNKKKRQLELSYRSDCETYGLVANKLIAKDRLLEDRLKLALLETMKELEVETMKQLDDFLDQITFMF